MPVNRGSGEDIVRVRADLVLTGPFDNRYTRALVAARGIDLYAVNAWEDFADGEKQTREFAAKIGQSGRGEALVGKIEAALARADAARVQRPQAPTSLMLQRRGYVFRSGLAHDIARRLGLRDLADGLGTQGSGFASLEALLRARPDYLIVSNADMLAMDQGQAFLAHPALQKLWPREKRLALDDSLSICGGPSTPQMIDTMIGEVRAKVR